MCEPHPRACRFVCAALVLIGLALRSGLSAAEDATASPQTAKPAVTLLVDGIEFPRLKPCEVWPQHQPDSCWTGLVGYLERQGLRFGGVIQAENGKFELPKCLHRADAEGNPQSATLFALTFSSAAHADGLAFRALELAAAIDELCRYTGCDRVRIVAHSAGGLVARAYVQSALPGLQYADNVSHLVTVSTPHLGSAMAGHVGDVLGTRATSIDHDAPLIERMNQQLPLPPDVRFASIVVRGLGADVRGKGSNYQPYLDPALLADLPVGFRYGGDQVVHVVSQNLALAKCARRYELATGRPVQFALARVEDPSPWDLPGIGARVHSAALNHQQVHEMVDRFLKDDEGLWTGLQQSAREKWTKHQAQQAAEGIVEQVALGRHPLSQVHQISLQELTALEPVEDGTARFRFQGSAASRNVVCCLRSRVTSVSGTLTITCDPFGRIVKCQHEILDRGDR